MKKLDITKPVTTRDGRPVTNVCVDADGRMWGLVGGRMYCVESGGPALNLKSSSSRDWINHPETHEITVYVYKDYDGSLFVATKHYNGLNLISKFTKTVKEGEGLQLVIDK